MFYLEYNQTKLTNKRKNNYIIFQIEHNYQ